MHRAPPRYPATALIRITTCAWLLAGLLHVQTSHIGAAAADAQGPAAQTIRLFVAPDGDDADDGSADAPLATLEGARDRARQLRADDALAGAAVEVTVRGGKYPLHAPFILEHRDGGTAHAPVLYRAAPGEAVQLVGGVELPADAFAPVQEEAVLQRIPEEARDSVTWVDLARFRAQDFPRRPDDYRNFTGPELFFQDERMQLARYPNEGWMTFTVDQVVDRGSTRSEPEDERRGGTFEYTADRPERWSVERGVWLYGYWCHDWYDQTHRVGAIDTENKRITLATPHGYGIGPSHAWNTAPRRYIAVNLLEELDAPGEWYLDVETSRLYFYPPEPLEDQRIVLSLCSEAMVQLENVQHVTLRGFIIECGQAGGVRIADGSDNLIEHCEIRNMGRGAVSLGGVRNGVRACHMHNLGTSGVGTWSGSRRTLTPGENFIEDCHIHDFGIHQRTYAPAIGLRGVGNRASHNHIHDAPHLAMEFSHNDNVIEFNNIHHVLMETSDAGALYTGRDWTTHGNVIRHNFIHQLGEWGVVGTWAIYMDDQDSGNTVFGNVLYRAGRGIFLAGGRSNRVANNVVVDGAAAVQIDARGVRGAPDGDPLAPYEPGATMMQRLQAVPYQEEPWRSRYPQLVNILDEAPRVPRYNVIRDNVAVNCREWLRLHRQEDMAFYEDPANHNVIASNYVLGEDEDAGFVDKEALNFQFRWDAPVWKQHPTFQRIPFERIGPRVPVGPQLTP